MDTGAGKQDHSIVVAGDAGTTPLARRESHGGSSHSTASDDIGKKTVAAVTEKPRSPPPRPTSKLDIGGHVRWAWGAHKLICCVVIWALITAYFIASLALKEKTQLSDVLPFVLLYAFISLKMLFAFASTRPVVQGVRRAAGHVRPMVRRVPALYIRLLGVAVLVAIVLSVALGLPGDSSGSRLERMQSFLGIVVITGLLVATSRDVRAINWHTVIVGFLLQFCLGCIVVKAKWGEDLFTWLAERARDLLAFSHYGADFLFGADIVKLGFFAISVFPAIVFFSALIQLTYYLGGMQWILRKLGWLFYKLLDTSGAEAIVASASPFIGQGENVLLVKDYLEHMTNSEIHACMTAGFSTISGSVLQGYITFGADPKNIITACIMSIPCSLALSKIRYPETEESLTRGKIVTPPKSTDEVNALHAIGNGAAIGISLCLLMAANLIAIVSLVSLVDFFLTWFGQFISIHNLTLELILGYLLYPYTWLLGVPADDVLKVSRILGSKFVVNEFYAYQMLFDETKGPAISTTMSARALAITEFALCGFGNLGSIAQQIGALGSLAPSRKADFSRIALSACVTGSIATTLSAAIISMIM